METRHWRSYEILSVDWNKTLKLDSHLIYRNQTSKKLLVVRQLDGDWIQDWAELDDPGDGEDQAAALLASSQKPDEVDTRYFLKKSEFCLKIFLQLMFFFSVKKVENPVGRINFENYNWFLV